MKIHRVHKEDYKYKISILPSELDVIGTNQEVIGDFGAYGMALLAKDKEVQKYYEHKYHGTEYQKIFNKYYETGD